MALKYTSLDNIDDIILELSNYKSENIIIDLYCTKDINKEALYKLRLYPNVFIRLNNVINIDSQLYYDLYCMKYGINLYTIDEMIKIIDKLEEIEAGIHPEWDNMAILMYLINYLKNGIIYHPNSDNQDSKNIRSLRSLYLGTGVCVSFAVILKELCDRLNIPNELIYGFTKEEHGQNPTHTWNIIDIYGYKIPVDLTFLASKNNRGNFLELSDIANLPNFLKHHFPDNVNEPINYYSIDANYIRALEQIINKDALYQNTTYELYRKDGTSFRITAVDQILYNGEYVYKYIYQDIDGSYVGLPKILYSKTNVTQYILFDIKKIFLMENLAKAKEDRNIILINKYSEELKKLEGSSKQVEVTANLLFSKTNIGYGIANNNNYIGKLTFDKNLNRPHIMIEPLFGKKIKNKQKTFKRKDNTSFVIETNNNLVYKNPRIRTYTIYEYEKNDKTNAIRKLTIFTEDNLFKANKDLVANKLLAKDNLDYAIYYHNGYVGSIKDGRIVYNKLISNNIKKGLLKLAKFSNKYIKNNTSLSFSEMKRLARCYKVIKIKGLNIIYNVYTKRLLFDKELISKVLFANMWLNEIGNGVVDIAFSPSNEEVYNLLYEEITDEMKLNGIFDPFAIIKKLDNKDKLYNLFKNKSNIKIIYNLFCQLLVDVRHSNKVIPNFEGMSMDEVIAYREDKDISDLLEAIMDNDKVEIKKYKRL